MKRCDELLRRTFKLTKIMVKLADQGDEAREDVGCGVLYGLVRDSAYKIRKVAEQEKEEHVRKGMRPEEDRSARGKAAEVKPSDLEPNRILIRR